MKVQVCRAMHLNGSYSNPHDLLQDCMKYMLAESMRLFSNPPVGVIRLLDQLDSTES